MCGSSVRPIDRRACSRREALLALIATAGVGLPGRVHAADEGAAFAAGTLADAVEALGAPLLNDPLITLTLPEVVENGAVVPVSVSSRLTGAQEIFLVVEHNPQPVAARFSIPPGTEAFVSTRLKLARSSVVYAAVLADGRLHCASKSAQVLVGGCG